MNKNKNQQGFISFILLITFVIVIGVTVYAYTQKRFQSKLDNQKPSIQPTLNITSVPSPQMIIKPAKAVVGANLPILFELPEGNFNIHSDEINDWGKEFNNAYAITRGIRIEDINSRVTYDFATATSENNKPFTWEGAPFWYVPSLLESDTNEQLINKLGLNYINTIYVKDVYLKNLNTFAKIVYSKNCYGNCWIDRRYLIPFEKTINNKIYHTLTFSTLIHELKTDPEEQNIETEKLKNELFADESFNKKGQDIIMIQDLIVKSLQFK